MERDNNNVKIIVHLTHLFSVLVIGNEYGPSLMVLNSANNLRGVIEVSFFISL